MGGAGGGPAGVGRAVDSRAPPLGCPLVLATPRPPGSPPTAGGLSLSPFRARRFAVPTERLGALLSPPYDVIDDEQRAALLERDPDNVVSVILPRSADDDSDPYQAAAAQLSRWIDPGRAGGPLLALDPEPALYVYDMRSSLGVTRGILGAVELRDPAEGVILPHEDVMAGPVADRLALMQATDANLEPIYLVYPGGGATSALVASVDHQQPLAMATTGDGIEHRLWAVTAQSAQTAVSADLGEHTAVIADGHHRYATYRELQRQRREQRGPGPWDRGLALLVDTSAYGARVEAIHRVVRQLDLATAQARLRQAPGPALRLTPVADLSDGMQRLGQLPDQGPTAVVVASQDGAVLVEGLTAQVAGPGSNLDVIAVHTDLIERRWAVNDTVDTVGYAHDVAEALSQAERQNGVAVLLRATPVQAVMDVARAGGRMPRKSTLFVPKPASGLVIRRFADDGSDQPRR